MTFQIAPYSFPRPGITRTIACRVRKKKSQQYQQQQQQPAASTSTQLNNSKTCERAIKKTHTHKQTE